ncbi:ATP-binding cassette domain-containing protein [uncultured Friedmanniella sp.]|uniref:ABC transporter ATP-binding protein n=1 Tax=uncultured Friedmanniella sp. TaxID=335381 RepID=UPI0035CB6430
MTSTDHAVVWTDQLSVGYRPGREVLTKLDVHLPSGLGQLRGANGSGKSTLVEVLAGRLDPWTGGAGLYGRDVRTARPLRRVCRSRPALYPTLTLREHLQLLADARVVELADALMRCERYGVGPWLDVPSDQLSTGNLRKAWIVLCTVPTVPLWLMDEPFNGLDESGAAVLVAEIGERVAAGLDVVLVAHQMPPGLTPTTVVELPSRSLVEAGDPR